MFAFLQDNHDLDCAMLFRMRTHVNVNKLPLIHWQYMLCIINIEEQDRRNSFIHANVVRQEQTIYFETNAGIFVWHSWLDVCVCVCSYMINRND